MKFIWSSLLSSKSEDKVHRRNLIMLAVIIISITLLVFKALIDWQNQRIQHSLEQHLSHFHDNVKSLLVSHTLSVDRITKRWQLNKGTPFKAWEADALSYINDFPSLQAIEWVDSTHYVRWIVPMAGNEAAVNLYSANTQSRYEALAKAKNELEFNLTQPIQLVQGFWGFLIYSPIFIEGEFEGFILGVVKLPTFFEKVDEISHLFENVHVIISYEDQVIFEDSSPNQIKLSEYEASQSFSYHGLVWETTMTLDQEQLNKLNTEIPFVVLFVGLIMTVLFVWIFHLRWHAQVKSQWLKRLIDEQKVIERELAKKEKQLRVTLETMVDAVIVSDKKGDILSFNKSAEKIFGYTAPEIISKNVRILMQHHHTVKHDVYIEKYLAGKPSKIVGIGREVQGVRANGEEFPMTIAISDIEIGDEHLFSSLIRDISDQKHNEKELLKYMKQLERSNKELDSFAYVASHDLKAPMRGIMQLAEWIEEDIEQDLDAQTRDYLRLMKSRIARLETLLDDLLKYSKVGKNHGDFSTVNIVELVDNIKTLYAISGGFEVKCKSEISTFTTLSVPLEIILRNLIGNAIKHHDKKSGVIIVSAQTTDSGYLFSVSDDGPGIPEEQYERAFKIFQTLRPRDEVEGSGMGLAIIKKILTQYHSNITIKPNVDRGVVFQFYWPNSDFLKIYINE